MLRQVILQSNLKKNTLILTSITIKKIKETKNNRRRHKETTLFLTTMESRKPNDITPQDLSQVLWGFRQLPTEFNYFTK